MKRKLKGLLLAVCMVFAALALPVGVYAAEDEITVSEADRSSLESYAQQNIESITAMTDEELEEILKPSTILSAPNKSLTLAAQSWSDAKEELGEFKSTDNHEIQVTDDEIIITTKASFEKSEGVITMTISRETLAMSGIVFDSNTDTSLGSKMEKAALNTLMGLVIVFAMLIFLSFLISLFKHFGKLGGSGKKEEMKAVPAAPVPVLSEQEEELADDGELVAVIAAAIAASENTSTDSFTVRSIRKANKRKWQNA